MVDERSMSAKNHNFAKNLNFYQFLLKITKNQQKSTFLTVFAKKHQKSPFLTAFAKNRQKLSKFVKNHYFYTLLMKTTKICKNRNF